MMIYCPNCKALVMKGFEELDDQSCHFSFSVRCHSCKKDFSIKLATEISVMINGRVSKRLSGIEPQVRLMEGSG